MKSYQIERYGNGYLVTRAAPTQRIDAPAAVLGQVTREAFIFPTPKDMADWLATDCVAQSFVIAGGGAGGIGPIAGGIVGNARNDSMDGR